MRLSPPFSIKTSGSWSCAKIALELTGALTLVVSALVGRAGNAQDVLRSLSSTTPIVRSSQAPNPIATVAPETSRLPRVRMLPRATSRSHHLANHHRHAHHYKRLHHSIASHQHNPETFNTDIGAANDAARMQPVRDGFVNAIQHYPFTDGALYQLYAAPGEVTDIVLQEGEQLIGTGPVAAGDTVRWIIGDTLSGTAPNAHVHILVKPTRSGLVTNLVINTDRRSYHIEMHSTPATYMASLSWDYPQDALIALRASQVAAARVAPVATGIDVAALNFNYALSGDNPRWKPLRAFDDGTRVFVEFPDSIAQGDMPPLFVIGASGAAELVNYRVTGTHMIVDKLFDAAELRLGDKKSTQAVRITRVVPKAHRGFHL